MPAPRFFRLAMRLPYYQGALQARVLAEQEEQEGPGTTTSPELSSSGVDMRHNMAAAKAAAKGAGLKEGQDEVTMIPASAWMAQFPGLGERQEV